MNNPTHAQSNREREAKSPDASLSLDQETHRLVSNLIDAARALAAALEAYLNATGDDGDES